MDFKLTNILPRAGGTLDQDAAFMKDLRTIMSIEGQVDKVKHQKVEMKAKMKEGLKKGR